MPNILKVWQGRGEPDSILPVYKIQQMDDTGTTQQFWPLMDSFNASIILKLLQHAENAQAEL